MDDDYDDSRNGRKKEKNRRKKRGVKIPNVAKPVAKTAKTGGKILFKFINFLLRMGTLLLIAWIIYLLGLHFLTNVGPFGNIISRLTAADQELIAYLAVAGVLLLYEIIIFFCVLGGSRKQGRDGNTIDNGPGAYILYHYRSRLLSVCCVCKSHSADSCRTPGNPECIDCLRKFKEYITSNLCRRSCKLYNPEIYYKIVKKHRGRIECPVFFHFFYFFFLTRIFLINFRISQIITIIRKRSPAQIPTIIPANLFGCFNRSAIFLLSSTTFRRVSYYSNQKHLLFRLRLCLQTTAYILQLPPMPLILSCRL